MSELDETKTKQVEVPHPVVQRRTAPERWARQLGNGVKAHVTLRRPNTGVPLYLLDIVFRAEGADADWSTKRTVYVGEVADEIIAVLDRHGTVIESESAAPNQQEEEGGADKDLLPHNEWK